jgi:hypothetical protein
MKKLHPNLAVNKTVITRINHKESAKGFSTSSIFCRIF